MKNKRLCNEALQIEYSIFRPAGNNTAFVYGLDYTPEQKKCINDAIMEKHPNVEQVGFIGLGGKPELQMAGGEFCGNATRSAASVYLEHKEGNLQMIVNSKDLINAGVYKDGKAWCEIPLYHGENVVVEKEPGIFIVKMNGMVSIVLKERIAKPYLEKKEKLKEYGMEFIKKYNLEYSEAVGIMFCEEENGVFKINPVVWVRAINTLFYETACGSGTTAVCMVEAFLNKKSETRDILQPSGLIITAKIDYEKEIVKATISGNVETDGKKYSIKILLEREKDMMVRTIKEIAHDNYRDFDQLYKVFCEEPYYEKWTDEMIYKEHLDPVVMKIIIQYITIMMKE